MGGILGATLGESPAEAQARIEEARKTATDLTGLVRRKKTAKTSGESEAPAATISNGNGKRKADEIEGGAETKEEEDAKKTKLEPATDGEA